MKVNLSKRNINQANFKINQSLCILANAMPDAIAFGMEYEDDCFSGRDSQKKKV